MRTPRMALALAAALALAGCRTATVQSGSPTETNTTGPTTVPAGSDVIPSGTPLKVTLQDTLSTKESKVGDDVRATLTVPVKDSDGKTLVPAGTVIEGEVTGLAPSKSADQPAAIKVNFDTIAIEGKEKEIATEITDTKPEMVKDKGRMGKGAAIGGAAGLALGGIIGKSFGGALLGGLLGAGAGTAISLGTGDAQAKLPEGTPMTLVVKQPLSVR